MFATFGTKGIAHHFFRRIDQVNDLGGVFDGDEAFAEPSRLLHFHALRRFHRLRSEDPIGVNHCRLFPRLEVSELVQ